jgi:hypothetical protein
MVDLIRSGSHAVTEKIAAGERELVERAIVAALGKDFQAQRNRERVAEFAADELRQDCGMADAKADIDDDWLNVFAEQASRVSKEEMQRLWGRVLAGEIRQPGSFRLRTLQALSVLDAKEAQLIHDHMDLVLDGNALYAGADNEFTSFATLLELQDIGVLQGVGGHLNRAFAVSPEGIVMIHLSGNYGICIRSEKPQAINLSCKALTPFGRDLYTLAKPSAFRAGLPEAIAKVIKGNDRLIELVKITPHSVPNMYSFEVTRHLEQQTP